MHHISKYRSVTSSDSENSTETLIPSTVPAGFSDLGFSDHFGFRNSGFLDDQYINSTLGLATSIVLTKTGR